MDERRVGGCACGAVRFEARGRPKWVANCHCQDCRSSTGAAFSTWVGFDSENVTWFGERTLHERNDMVRRGFCARCGTPLSYSGKQWQHETHLLVGTFDAPGELTPGEDVFTAEKLPWVRVPTHS